MKSTRRFFEAAGIWVAIMPFLHFPVNVRNVLYVITGVTIFVASYLYLRRRIAIAKDKIEPTFVEAKPVETIVESTIEPL
jgi:hypothetical protein